MKTKYNGMAPSNGVNKQINKNTKTPVKGTPTRGTILGIPVKRSPLKKSPKTNGFSVPRKMVSLFQAVENGDMETLKELLAYTGPAIRKAKCRCTLLHVAAANNQTELVSFLLKLISPNTVNSDNETPAHLAAKKGHTKVLRLLLADGETNPNIKDNSYNTFRDRLFQPLFDAILSGNERQVKELIELGANPDHNVVSNIEGALGRELNITTSRQLAATLCNKSINTMLAKIKPAQDLTSLLDINDPPDVENGISNDDMRGPLRLKVKPAVQLQSGSDVYTMNTYPKGYVCILNYSSFKDRPDLELEASPDDARNLANVFGQMGYTRVVHSSLSGKDTKNTLLKIRDMDVLYGSGCAIFIISSHGVHNDTFLTSDMEQISTDWILNLFKDTECPQLKGKPKLFIFDFCGGYYNANDDCKPSGSCLSSRVQEPLRDVMCLYSSNGAFTSYSYTKDGSAFATSLCRTLARHAHNKELNELYKELVGECAKKSLSAVPYMRNIGFTKSFYFSPEFS